MISGKVKFLFPVASGGIWRKADPPMIALRENIPTDFVSRISEMFAPGGLLSSAKNFEYRPEPQRMAVAVARALEDGAHLVVEAGTGVGKSLVYLVPAVLFAGRGRARP